MELQTELINISSQKIDSSLWNIECFVQKNNKRHILESSL